MAVQRAPPRVYPAVIFLWGLIIWLVPLAVSILFYDQKGQLQTSEHWFKKVMGVTSAAVSALGFARTLPVASTPLQGGVVAMAFIVINWALDYLLFVHYGLGGHTLYTWFVEIGAGYLAGLPMGILAGSMSQRATQPKRR